MLLTFISIRFVSNGSFFSTTEGFSWVSIKSYVILYVKGAFGLQAIYKVWKVFV